MGDCDLTGTTQHAHTRSNPSVTACAVPLAYASGPSVAARHLPTLWGVTLYTREALEYRRGGFHIRPYNPAQLSNYKEEARTLQGTTLLLQPPRIAYLFKCNQPHIAHHTLPPKQKTKYV